jgi:hypothetical protein
MEDHHLKPISQVLSSRQGFLQLVLIGVLLALATNILATIITTKANWFSAMAVGILLLIIVCVYAVQSAMAARVIRRSFTAALVLSEDDLQPQTTEIYEFSGDMARILKAVFYENKAFADAWQREPVTKYWDLDARQATAMRVSKEGGLKLLHEALETWLMQELSTQLIDYYDHLDKSEQYTAKFERQHVPSLLLENRVLNLLSTPVIDRAAFVEPSNAAKQPTNEPESKGVVYAQFGPGDAIYERFELVLPKGSMLSRHPSGALTIDTPRLQLSLRAKHEGYTASLPFRFISRYYGLDPMKAAILLIQFEVTGRIKLLGMLHGQGWHLYHWVDSFVDKIEKAASIKAMLTRIQWPSIEALLIASEKSSEVSEIV